MREVRLTRTVSHLAAAEVGWVVLATEEDRRASHAEVPGELVRHGFSVHEVSIGRRCPSEVALSALREAEGDVRREHPGALGLLGGVRWPPGSPPR
jgi:hypothetical protein